MSHERHFSITTLFALLILPAAVAAETMLEPVNQPVSVQEGRTEFTGNNAAAIDQDGNILIAYKKRPGELGSAARQTVDAFASNGETARYEAPEFELIGSEFPSVTHMLGDIFAVTRATDTGDEFNPGLTVEFLRFTDEGSGSAKGAETKRSLQELPGGTEIRSRLQDELPDACETPDFKDVSYVKEARGSGDGQYNVIVECNSKSYKITFFVFVFFGPFTNTDGDSVTLRVIDVEQLTKDFGGGSAKRGNKANLGPTMAEPLSASGRRRNAGILAYFGERESSEEAKSHRGSNVTMLELGDDPVVTSVLQITDPLPMNFPEGSIATCGFPDRDHYWVAFATEEGRAVAARVADTVQDIVDLGPTSGAVDIACDGWGNAVVSWADTSAGAKVQTAVLGPGGQVLDSHERGSLGFPEMPDAEDFRVSNDVNEAGEVVLAWTDGGESLAFQRLKLQGHFRIDGTLSGSFFNPAFDGEGFIFDVVEIDGTPTMVIYYFTYNDNGSGDPTWLVGSAPIEDNRAVADMITGTGATFGADFDPEDVVRKKAGTVTATFLGCGLVTVAADSNRFGQQAYIAQPLTGLPLSVSGQCGSGPEGTAQVDASRGGSLFTPSRDGEGFIFDIVEIDGTPTPVAYYFTYQPDGSGDPAWMVGTGPIEGDSATVTMTIAEGATFGPDFDPADVERTEWGEIQVTWQTCEDVSIEYDGLWGEGSFNVGPLTPALIGATGLCAP